MNDDLDAYFQHMKPHLKDSSRRVYVSTFSKLLSLLDIDFDGDDSIKEMISRRHALYEVLGTYNVNTAKNHFNVIAEVIRHSYHEEDRKEVMTEAYKLRDDTSQLYHKKVAAHLYSDNQKSKVIEWEDVLAVRTALELELNQRRVRSKITHKEVLTDSEIHLLQDAVIVGLYTYLPPLRNDFANIKVLTGKEYRDLSKDDRTNYNYLVRYAKSTKFYLHQFKTSKTHGSIVMEVPKPLKLLINFWLRVNDSGVLLINRNNETLSANGLSKYLSQIFERYTKKRIGSQMLRHIFLSSEFGEEIRKELESYSYKKGVAHAMGHSVKTQGDYVKIG